MAWSSTSNIARHSDNARVILALSLSPLSLSQISEEYCKMRGGKYVRGRKGEGKGRRASWREGRGGEGAMSKINGRSSKGWEGENRISDATQPLFWSLISQKNISACRLSKRRKSEGIEPWNEIELSIYIVIEFTSNWGKMTNGNHFRVLQEDRLILTTTFPSNKAQIEGVILEEGNIFSIPLISRHHVDSVFAVSH